MGDWVKAWVRTIPDFPKEGINFRDVTTLLADSYSFRRVIDEFTLKLNEYGIQKIAAIDARGFLLGGALAHQLGAGLVPFRKRGKLPNSVFLEEFENDYGKAELEVHRDAIGEGDVCLIVDDIIATGGTAEASINLIERAGGKVAGACFILDLPEFGGADRIRDRGFEVIALTEYNGND